MIYNINETPKTIKEWILYTLQMVLAVFVATVLIANICNTPISSCLFGACIGTLIYQIITKFKSPMFISSCGATCSAVIGALAISTTGEQNYLLVAVGGLMIALIYIGFALIIHLKGYEVLDKIFPATIVGPVTMVIGLNLAKFLVTYTNDSNPWQVGIAILTMLIVAVSSHYFKGFLKTIPFLFGLLGGYLISLLVTELGWASIIDFSKFNPDTWSWYPDLTFLKWDFSNFKFASIGSVALLFIPVSICAILEHFSDHKTLSNIIGKDLTKDPGLTRTLIGDGVASFVGTVVCGLPNTSYGESIATIGFSRVASVLITTAAALFLGVLSFIAPVNVFIQTIPSCVFGGCAMILYGYIAASGLKTVINSKVDLEDNKNLIVTSVILTTGVSGIFFISESLTGVSLAMILGVILNLILIKKKGE